MTPFAVAAFAELITIITVITVITVITIGAYMAAAHDDTIERVIEEWRRHARKYDQ